MPNPDEVPRVRDVLVAIRRSDARARIRRTVVEEPSRRSTLCRSPHSREDRTRRPLSTSGTGIW